MKLMPPDEIRSFDGNCTAASKKQVDEVYWAYLLFTGKASYQLMVVVHVPLWRVNVKTIPGFIHIPLADLS
jgi:hypothetical protein